jgi:general secretion pathway protein N
MAEPTLFRLRWPHYLLAALVYLVLLLAWAPASLLAWALPRFTQQAVWLEHAEGSVWHGQATGLTVQTGSAPALQLGRVNWQMRPLDLFVGKLGYRLKLEGAGIDAAGVLRVGSQDMELQTVRVELPAAWLAQWSPDLGLWQPGGRLVFETSHLAINPQQSVKGQATLRWLDAVSGRVRPPLGSYRANIEGAGNALELKLATESGPLFLQGMGTWSRQRGLAFNGTARAAPERRAELDGLLSLIGPAQADGGRAIRIDR